MRKIIFCLTASLLLSTGCSIVNEEELVEEKTDVKENVEEKVKTEDELLLEKDFHNMKKSVNDQEIVNELEVLEEQLRNQLHDGENKEVLKARADLVKEKIEKLENIEEYQPDTYLDIERMKNVILQEAKIELLTFIKNQ